jgi:hypothetical protein
MLVENDPCFGHGKGIFPLHSVDVFNGLDRFYYRETSVTLYRRVKQEIKDDRSEPGLQNSTRYKTDEYL